MELFLNEVQGSHRISNGALFYRDRRIYSIPCLGIFYAVFWIWILSLDWKLLEPVRKNEVRKISIEQQPLESKSQNSELHSLTSIEWMNNQTNLSINITAVGEWDKLNCFAIRGLFVT